MLALDGLPRVLADAAAEHDVHAVLPERAGDRLVAEILGGDDLAGHGIEVCDRVDLEFLRAAEMLEKHTVLIRHCDLHIFYLLCLR